MEVVGRVQSIASETQTKQTIPSQFIWSSEDIINNQGKTTLNVDPTHLQVPVIALDDTNEERLVSMIAKASSEIGMFQVINHGIPNDLIAKFQKVGKEFFELPQEVKEKYAKVPGSVEGYGSTLQKEDESKNEVKKGWVDHIFQRIWPPSVINLKFWPNDHVDSYQEVTLEYAKYLKEVGDKLFKYLALGLGLEGHELKEAAGGEAIEYLLKINYYPLCPRPDLALGVPPHSDMSAITLLIPNDVPGLQIQKDDRWYNVDYVPNAIVIHIGDQIEIMSNGKYKSVMHRSTVNKDRARYSWPVFLEPPSDHTVGPLPQFVTKENPAKYKSKKYSDYAYCKYNRLPQ